MSDSGILQEAIMIEEVNKKSATHFALCNGEQIRYLISLKGGKKRLGLNVATYSNKLGILMMMLDFLPLSIFKLAKLGYFVKAGLHPVIERQFSYTELEAWNLIVGTYDEKQKLVLQCFNSNKKPALFIKVGNNATETEMKTEISFLRSMQKYHSFSVPEILGSQFRSADCPFNIQITKEFVGEKIEPLLTKDIVCIYKEIAGKPQMLNGIVCEFSHGDFAPWNIKKNGHNYTVFDWEHCGMRMKGFDLMHFATIIEIVLGGQSFQDAFDIGLEKIKKFEPGFSIDKRQFLEEFEKLRVQIG